MQQAGRQAVGRSVGQAGRVGSGRVRGGPGSRHSNGGGALPQVRVRRGGRGVRVRFWRGCGRRCGCGRGWGLGLGLRAVPRGGPAHGAALLVLVEHDVACEHGTRGRQRREGKRVAMPRRATRMTRTRMDWRDGARTLVLDELAKVVVGPQRAEDGRVRVRVVVADERAEVARRLRAVICAPSEQPSQRAARVRAWCVQRRKGACTYVRCEMWKNMEEGGSYEGGNENVEVREEGGGEDAGTVLTERHLGEEVVHDVVVGDVVQEEAALPAEEVAVDGARGAALEGPLALAEVRERGVRVVEVGDHDELRDRV
jgi:hypothetical protein